MKPYIYLCMEIIPTPTRHWCKINKKRRNRRHQPHLVLILLFSHWTLFLKHFKLDKHKCNIVIVKSCNFIYLNVEWWTFYNMIIRNYNLLWHFSLFFPVCKVKRFLQLRVCLLHQFTTTIGSTNEPLSELYFTWKHIIDVELTIKQACVVKIKLIS